MDFPPTWLTAAGIPNALAAAAVLMGWLIPRWTYNQTRKDLSVWRQTAETALAANRELADQFGRLVATNERLIENQRDLEALIRGWVASTTVVRRDQT